jgi:hypothetical protein
MCAAGRCRFPSALEERWISLPASIPRARLGTTSVLEWLWRMLADPRRLARAMGRTSVSFSRGPPACSPPAHGAPGPYSVAPAETEPPDLGPRRSSCRFAVFRNRLRPPVCPGIDRSRRKSVPGRRFAGADWLTSLELGALLHLVGGATAVRAARCSFCSARGACERLLEESRLTGYFEIFPPRRRPGRGILGAAGEARPAIYSAASGTS